ncbi:MAG: hypothetical protein ACYCWE_02430 [Eubacteriales bacterium]
MLSIIKSCKRSGGTLTTRFNPRKNAVKERFMNIMDMTKKKKGLWLIALALLICLTSGAVTVCTIGKRESSMFDVIMTEAYAKTSPIKMTVHLPNNGRESDIAFTIDGIEYAVASMPTVNDPTFYFGDKNDDDMRSISLIMVAARNKSGVAELHVMPDEGTELVFVSEMAAFSKLLNFLGNN